MSPARSRRSASGTPPTSRSRGRPPTRARWRCAGGSRAPGPTSPPRQFADELSRGRQGPVAAGIEAGDRVAVMSKTRYEWTVADFALFTVGAVVVPIYETSSAEQVQWILSDSGAKAIFVESAEHAALVESVRDQDPGPGARLDVRGRRDPGPRQGRRRRRRRGGGPAARRGDARRPRVDHLHVRHDRPAEGLRTHPPLLRRAGARAARRAGRVLQRSGRRRCCSCRSRTSSAG